MDPAIHEKHFSGELFIEQYNFFETPDAILITQKIQYFKWNTIDMKSQPSNPIHSKDAMFIRKRLNTNTLTRVMNN